MHTTNFTVEESDNDRNDNEDIIDQNIPADPSINIDDISETASPTVITLPSPLRPPISKEKEPTSTTAITATTTSNSRSRKRIPHAKIEDESNSSHHHDRQKNNKENYVKVKSDLMNGMEVEKGSIYFYLQQRHDYFDTSFMQQLQDNNIKENNNFLRKEELGEISPTTAANQIVNVIRSNIQQRMEVLYETAQSHFCRAQIAEQFSHYLNAITYEKPLSFISRDNKFFNQCSENRSQIFDMYNRRETWGTYKPSPQITKYMSDDDYNNEFVFLYTISIHDHDHGHDNSNVAEDIINLIERLQDVDKHLFIIHIDGKQCHDNTFDAMKQYADLHKKNIYVLPNRLHSNVNGFSMVQATLLMFEFAFGLVNDDGTEEKQPLSFHKVIHLPSSVLQHSKTIDSKRIKKIIQSYPMDANIMDVQYEKLYSSTSNSWKYVIECDDSIHEIGNLPILNRKQHNTDIFSSNQKSFIISNDFAEYLAKSSPKRSFVNDFTKYAKHIANANYYFFATVLLHSSFCHKFVNVDFLDTFPLK